MAGVKGGSDGKADDSAGFDDEGVQKRSGAK
jgi:hypothetical protein